MTPVGWNMIRTSARRVVAALGGGVVAAAGVLAFGVAPAHAAATGLLLSKVAGSNYSEAVEMYQGVIPGGKARAFYYKIVNTSPTAENFKVNVTEFDPVELESTLYKGSKKLPNEYVTNAIPAGRTLTLKLMVKVTAGTPPGAYGAQVLLRNPMTNQTLDVRNAFAFGTYQTGTTHNDLFVKTGSQPYAGGSHGQYESSNALKVGKTATFLLRLKNNGTTHAAISLFRRVLSNCGEVSMTVKQGTQNVTDRVGNGTYNTGTLAPGAKRDLKVIFKLQSAPPWCSQRFEEFIASGPDGFSIQHAHLLIAA